MSCRYCYLSTCTRKGATGPTGPTGATGQRVLINGFILITTSELRVLLVLESLVQQVQLVSSELQVLE